MSAAHSHALDRVGGLPRAGSEHAPPRPEQLLSSRRGHFDVDLGSSGSGFVRPRCRCGLSVHIRGSLRDELHARRHAADRDSKPLSSPSDGLPDQPSTDSPRLAPCANESPSGARGATPLARHGAPSLLLPLVAVGGQPSGSHSPDGVPAWRSPLPRRREHRLGQWFPGDSRLDSPGLDAKPRPPGQRAQAALPRRWRGDRGGRP